ncbi:MAG: hypothetical protein CME70_00350 [Halobacteriovorax sp.]|nr:hypothetical protein [Halobacteriovorax sp.]|tara:strand:- start:12602 stop:13318 length:717 start_codon:yes stop_codon:yes gene_type:complete
MNTALMTHKFKNKLRSLRTRFIHNPNLAAHKGSEFEVNKWNTSEFVVSTLLPITGHHPFPVTEQMLMASAVCYLKPSHIFDWGTNIGVSARLFYETAKHFGIDSKIHSIDLPMEIEHEEHPKDHRGKLVRGLSNVTLHEGDGAETSVEIAKTSKVKNPLFLLDGDHSYETVTRELDYINKNIEKPNFIIHDTFFQSSESNYNIGPHQAVAEFLEKYPNQYTKIECNLGLPGMTLLLKK